MKEVFGMKIKALVCAVLCAALSFSALASCAPSEKKEPATQAKSYYDYFDTVSTVISYMGEPAEEFAANCEAVSTLLGRYHRLFDIYHEYDGENNLKTVNKNAGKTPVKVDGELIDFLLYCKEIFTLTNGKTNIAMGSVLKLWHDCREDAFDNPSAAVIPTEAELLEAAAHTDINNLIIDEENSTVYLADPNMRLDVGALGKGYATERAREALVARGVTSYVLNIGGNISAIGEKPSGEGWRTSITNPEKAEDKPYILTVNLKDTACVTSGNYERYYTVGGIRYHHIIDKDTLMPSEYFSSVTVFVNDSALADALSTALFNVSYEEGLALINEIGGIDVLWVTTEGDIYMTDGVKDITLS